MKYQELIISPDVFSKLSNYECLDYNTYSSNLKNKKLLFDKSVEKESKLFSEIQKVREKFDDFGKNIVDSLFGDVWVADNFEFIKIEEKTYIKNNLILNLLINIAKFSNDKIIHSENDELKIFLNFNQLGQEIELVSFNDFVNPSSQSRLVNVPRKIILVKNDTFILSKLLKGYLAGVNSIIIVDQYVRKFSGGYWVLKNLLKEGTDLKEIIIKTNFNDRAQQNEEEYIGREKLTNSIINITGIKPTLDQSKIHDRSLILDNRIKIRLSSGLDFVNQETNKVWRDEVSIDVEYL